jgi:hypothetical protein
VSICVDRASRSVMFHASSGNVFIDVDWRFRIASPRFGLRLVNSGTVPVCQSRRFYHPSFPLLLLLPPLSFFLKWFPLITRVMISRRILVASRLLRAGRTPQLRYSFPIQQFRSYADRIVKVPDMAESITEGTLKQWSKKVGDYVEQDEEIATIETDKVCLA